MFFRKKFQIAVNLYFFKIKGRCGYKGICASVSNKSRVAKAATFCFCHYGYINKYLLLNKEIL